MGGATQATPASKRRQGATREETPPPPAAQSHLGTFQAAGKKVPAISHRWRTRRRQSPHGPQPTAPKEQGKSRQGRRRPAPQGVETPEERQQQVLERDTAIQVTGITGPQGATETERPPPITRKVRKWRQRRKGRTPLNARKRAHSTEPRRPQRSAPSHPEAAPKKCRSGKEWGTGPQRTS